GTRPAGHNEGVVAGAAGQVGDLDTGEGEAGTSGDGQRRVGEGEGARALQDDRVAAAGPAVQRAGTRPAGHREDVVPGAAGQVGDLDAGEGEAGTSSDGQRRVGEGEGARALQDDRVAGAAPAVHRAGTRPAGHREGVVAGAARQVGDLDARQRVLAGTGQAGVREDEVDVAGLHDRVGAQAAGQDVVAAAAGQDGVAAGRVGGRKPG